MEGMQAEVHVPEAATQTNANVPTVPPVTPKRKSQNEVLDFLKEKYDREFQFRERNLELEREKMQLEREKFEVEKKEKLAMIALLQSQKN